MFHVKKLFDQVLSTFKPHYETKKVTLLSELSKPDLCVYADLEKSLQILSNLTLNALRHTSEGGKVKVTAKEQDNHLWMAYAWHEIGEMYHGMDKRTLAQENYDEALKLYKQNHALVDIEKLTEFMYSEGYGFIPCQEYEKMRAKIHSIKSL